jgi:hypothetical protein
MRRDLCESIDESRPKVEYINKNLCMCVCFYVKHNSGTPGAISTKLGTHMALWMCKNLMYIYYIFFLSPKHHFQQGGWCGRPAWDRPPPGVTNRCRVNVYANRYRSCAGTYIQTCVHLFVFKYVNRALQLRCHRMVKFLNFCVSGQCRIR